MTGHGRGAEADDPTADPTADRGIQLSPDSPRWADAASQGLGVYVHVPFCSRRCGYCDFAAFDGLDPLMDAYVDAAVHEIARRVDRPVATVFVGGGTPSRLPSDLLASLLRAIPLEAGAEITVEMNPESAIREVLDAAVSAGCTRVSMGMQSAVPQVLAVLDRTHDPGDVAVAVANVRDAGIEELNLDLIYGVPGESEKDWEETLTAALAFEPDHLSCYALTVEPGTPLARGVATGEVRVPDEDVAADRLEHTVAVLRAEGFVRYEVSNWARRRPCMHNLRYWSDGAYMGIGCAAHSYDPNAGIRAWNVRHPSAYVAAEPGEWAAGSETLTDEQRAEEHLMLGLRRVCGIEWDSEVPNELVEAGFMLVDPGTRPSGRQRLRLTDRGLAMAGAIITDMSLRSRRW